MQMQANLVKKKISKRIKGTTLDDCVGSTSSCSYDDHSSSIDKSEDLNQDLDYGEDSEADSQSVLIQMKNVESPIDVDVGLIDSPSSIEDNVADAIDARKSPHHDTDPMLKKDTDVNTTRKQIKLKSFVSRDHQAHEASEKRTRRDSQDHHKDDKTYRYLMKHFFKDAVYFQMKSVNHENVELSKSLGVWSTPIQNEIRLNTAFQQHRNVILIFSVQQSGAFQGFARMVSRSKTPSRPIPWILPGRLSSRSLGGVFKLEWLCKKQLPFYDTHDLLNPFNENKPVKVARDGQQLEPKVGKKLCSLFARDNKEQLYESISTLKRQVSQRKRSSRKNDDFYPMVDRRRFAKPSPAGSFTRDRRDHASHLGIFQSYPPTHLTGTEPPLGTWIMLTDHRYRSYVDRNTPNAYIRSTSYFAEVPEEPALGPRGPTIYQPPYYPTNESQNMFGWTSPQDRFDQRPPHQRVHRR